jgi:hypothetical protein
MSWCRIQLEEADAIGRTKEVANGPANGTALLNGNGWRAENQPSYLNFELPWEFRTRRRRLIRRLT